ncbi:MAG: anti-sigma factor [Pseudomonadota bacterium]
MKLENEKLSAFLDGELSEAETREIEDALASDPALQKEMELLMASDTLAQDEFAEMLQEPVPFELAAAIQKAPDASMARMANSQEKPRSYAWLTAIAACIALMIGGAGGYLAGSTNTAQLAAAPSWLEDIADYHRVYAGQKRHLVEVPASEADHIQTWLTNTVGANVRVPDLSEHGLTFRGARLLVAAGKPVAQLMFTDAQDRVVALCLIRTQTPADGFNQRIINGFEMVSWGGQGANFVIVGDEGRSDLEAIAKTASVDV